MNESDAIHVRRLRDLLDCYRPSARPVVDELIVGLRECLSANGTAAFRAVRGELGWSTDFFYCTDPAAAEAFASFLTSAQDEWTPFFPTTPKALRNRAVRTRVVHEDRVIRPTPAARDFIKLVDALPSYGMAKDDLGISICDGPVALGWIGATRSAPFGRREIEIVNALAPSLRARMLLEHQLGHARASQALLEVALDAIPTATFILAGSSIAHANATGRAVLDGDRPGVAEMLRESLVANGKPDAPFAVTPVELPGVSSMALAVLRGGDSPSERLRQQMARFTTVFSLSSRQREVLDLLAQGHANKTIAQLLRIAEVTVEEHITVLLRKTRADSRNSLVAKFWML
jgi:DNA-binding CsgD family transcriptional regulator